MRELCIIEFIDEPKHYELLYYNKNYKNNELLFNNTDIKNIENKNEVNNDVKNIKSYGLYRNLDKINSYYIISL